MFHMELNEGKMSLPTLENRDWSGGKFEIVCTLEDEAEYGHEADFAWMFLNFAFRLI